MEVLYLSLSSEPLIIKVFLLKQEDLNLSSDPLFKEFIHLVQEDSKASLFSFFH